MSVTPEELRLLLSNEEPDYPSIANQLDASALEALDGLAAGPDTMLASKAVYLASLLPDGEGVVARAAASGDPVLHAAAASGLRNLAPEARDAVATDLLGRGDAAIDKIAVRALGPDLTPELAQRLQDLAQSSDSEIVRDLSRNRLQSRS